MTLEEVAYALDMSIEGVRQIEMGALLKLKHTLTEDVLDMLRDEVREQEGTTNMYDALTDAMYQSSFDFEDDGLGDFWKEENVSEQ